MRSPTPDRAVRRRHPRFSRVAAVYLYGLVLGAAAALLFATTAGSARPIADPHLPWWAIGVGFLLAEACVVHLEFSRSAHSFSLADIPFVFGLVFASGGDFLAGALLGSAVVYAWRRLAPVKLAFNLAQLALVCSVAVVITQAIADRGDATDTRTWLGLYAATVTAGVLTIVCIGGAIAIAEGGMRWSTLRQMLAMDGVVTLTNSSIAIAGALVVSVDARAVPILLVPAIAVYLVYRAYVNERQRHEKLEFLYEANRTLSRSPEVADAIEGVLARSREAFRSEIAEVVLFSGDGTPLRTTYGPGDQRVTMVRADRELVEEITAMLRGDTQVKALAAPFDSARLRTLFVERRIRHAMIAALPGENRMIGTIMIANRFGIERGYGLDDLRLLEVLANNASVALQYDRLEQAVVKLRTLQEQLHHQAYHDPLTDLPNRALFMEVLGRELAAEDGTVAVLFIDIDDFKVVNDSLGHAIGDALLVSVAGRLRHSVRPQDVVARLGGDEFAVMLPRSDDSRAQAQAVAERILAALQRPVQAGSELISTHLSVGIAMGGADADADRIVREADLAMYQAKSRGKSRFEVFHPAMATAMVRLHDVKEDLADAIARDEIVVEYQPIVSLATGRIIAAEALVRWDHPARGRVPPSEFIPLCEHTGLIHRLDRHVMREACRQARLWQDLGGDEPLRVHVNLSVADLRDGELVPDVRAMLRATGLEPGLLVVEVTETQLMSESSGSADALRALRALGVRIALDDFGTGYSSLSSLHSLHFDSLKIAKPFVDALAGDGRRATFVRTIVELARTLELEVIAEGIESEVQLDALREMGAELGQGYLLGRPSPAAHGTLARRAAPVS